MLSCVQAVGANNLSHSWAQFRENGAAHIAVLVTFLSATCRGIWATASLWLVTVRARAPQYPTPRMPKPKPKDWALHLKLRGTQQFKEVNHTKLWAPTTSHDKKQLRPPFLDHHVGVSGSAHIWQRLRASLLAPQLLRALSKGWPLAAPRLRRCPSWFGKQTRKLPWKRLGFSSPSTHTSRGRFSRCRRTQSNT